MTSNAVDLVVGGPPKSGTSSLFAVLASHPDVVESHAKEPVFFTTDVGLDEGQGDGPARSGTFGRGMGWYDDLFDDRPGARRLEGSADYFPSPTAPTLLARHAPGVHLVFCLREPAERLVSHHWHERRFLDLPDLGTMLADGHPRLDYHLRCSRYGEHLERWLEAHGTARVHVVGFQQVREDVRGVAKGVLTAMGLDAESLPSVELGAQEANVAGQSRSRHLHRLLTVSRTRRLAERLPDALQRPVRNLARRAMHANLERTTYPPPRPEDLAEVRARLAGDRERLAALLATDWPAVAAEVDGWPRA